MSSDIGDRLGMALMLGVFFSIVWGGACMGSMLIPLLVPDILPFFDLGDNLLKSVPSEVQVGVLSLIWAMAAGALVGGAQGSALREQGISERRLRVATMLGWAVGTLIAVEIGFWIHGFTEIRTLAFCVIIVAISLGASVLQVVVLGRSQGPWLRWIAGGVISGGIGSTAWYVISTWVEYMSKSPMWSDEETVVMFVYGVAVIVAGAIWGFVEGVRTSIGTGTAGQAILREES